MAQAYRTGKKQQRGAMVQAAKAAILEKLQELFDSKDISKEQA